MEETRLHLRERLWESKFEISSKNYLYGYIEQYKSKETYKYNALNFFLSLYYVTKSNLYN